MMFRLVKVSHEHLTHADIEMRSGIVTLLQSLQVVIPAFLRLVFQILIVEIADLGIDVAAVVLVLFQIKIDLQRIFIVSVFQKQPSLVFQQVFVCAAV